jgi:hypothetical protein
MWAIIVVDRHTDPEVTLFTDWSRAVAQAEAWAEEWGSDWKALFPDSWSEHNTPEEHARYCWTYSPEGDHITFAWLLSLPRPSGGA